VRRNLFDRVWGPLDTLDETGQIELTTDWKKASIPDKKEMTN
jgi:hypothetical protein